MSLPRWAIERDQDEIEHQSWREARTVRLERVLVHKKEKQSKKGRGDHTADPREVGNGVRQRADVRNDCKFRLNLVDRIHRT